MSTENSVPYHQSTLFQLWFRRDIDEETARAHWLGAHAQLVAVTPGLWEYRQHHFESGPGIWPAVEGVDTEIPESERMDGSPEATLAHALSPVLSAPQNRRVAADEASAFRRTVMNITALRGTQWIRTGAGIGARTVIYLRSRSGAADRGFTAFVNDVLAPALEAETGLLEIRVATYQPWKQALWNTPNVDHSNPPGKQFHGSLILGAADRDALSSALVRVSAELGDELRSHLAAVHAYPVSRTHVFRQDGRITLPRDNVAPPRRKQRLHPERLTLPPIPPRSSARTGSTPMGRGRLLPLPGSGPEHVIATTDGRLITGVKDGRIVLVDPVTTATSIVADTGGRPLGVTLLDSETLLVCDAHRGLLSISLADSRVTVLVEDIDGVPLRFCSNAATAPDGSIWFTESTHRYDYEQYLGAFFERAPTGRVFRRDADGSVELVAEQMYFPNGIALTPDGSAMLVAETSAARIQRIPVTGARAGVPSIVAGNLPGYPDNLSAFVDGRSWVALVTPRSATLERLGSTPGIIPRTLWKLPDRLSASGPTSAWMWAIDEEGTMVHDMQSYDVGVTDLTGVAELDGTLYGVSPDNAAIFAVPGPKQGRES